jgi:hypothetical protein
MMAHEEFKLIKAPHEMRVEPCPVCGADAEIYQFSEAPGEDVQRVVMCSNTDPIGPQDGLVNDGCLLQLPPMAFYKATAKSAIIYWNEFAVALNAKRRANNWKNHSALRG